MNPKSFKLGIAILFLIHRSGVKLEQNIELVRVRFRVLVRVRVRVPILVRAYQSKISRNVVHIFEGT